MNKSAQGEFLLIRFYLCEYHFAVIDDYLLRGPFGLLNFSPPDGLLAEADDEVDAGVTDPDPGVSSSVTSNSLNSNSSKSPTSKFLSNTISSLRYVFKWFIKAFFEAA